MPGQTTTTRWRRFGHDRLFVDHAGKRVGWRDLLTDEDHLEDEAFAGAYREAVATWLIQQRGPADPEPAELASTEPEHDPEPRNSPQPGSEPVTGTVLPADHVCHDLADNLPAASTAVRAEELRVEREREKARHRDEIEGLVEVLRAEAAAAEAAYRRAHPIRGRLRRIFGRNPLEETIAIEVERLRAHGPAISNEERAWSLGADGERQVATQLTRLPTGWHVLHAIPVGDRGTDIDHLVIGPNGVFSINTKHHPGKQIWVASRKLMVNGHSTAYLPTSRHEGERVTRLLATQTGWQIPATPVIAFVGAAKITVKEQPADVAVLAAADLSGWLLAQPRLLAEDHVETVRAAARRCRTWHDR